MYPRYGNFSLKYLIYGRNENLLGLIDHPHEYSNGALGNPDISGHLVTHIVQFLERHVQP